jgi:hypothetical protein
MPNPSSNSSVTAEITGSIVKSKEASHSRIHECIKYSEAAGHAVDKYSRRKWSEQS